MNTQAYPPVQVAMTTERESNAVEQLQKQDGKHTHSTRLRGGGCIKGCLETICCCCALEAVCCCK
ncbi:hypothetical protein DM01DRAFT_299361 [Hesseltinella vesiculosa]|uniref:Cysteine-rich transmembrane domain-containing protein n=1 Tax=Hesseltinella vesiculosa TaxID=101127 RepID=A0A1X2GE52_9FUNG|nr:hypothetical protein DM01DRAFT_299361 [Hesseltinella vesiculosa]